jgi:peptidoglycan/xylan/chitin deacetylase (PgdA/CDA1 family)
MTSTPLKFEPTSPGALNRATRTVPLERGAFVLSIDTELMWGSFHRMSVSEFEARNGNLREVIAMILAMLDRYHVPVTWAMVGHLFLDSCDRAEDGRAHPDVVRPTYDWYPHDWYRQDPCTDLATDPLWYGTDVLELVRSARASHEIGSHSFGHLVFGDLGCPAEAARDDIEAWSAAARDRGISGRSFVFPRNRVGHLDLVAAGGFRCYRGYRMPASQSLSHRAPDALRDVLGMSANPSKPTVTASGLLEIPGSMPFLVPRGRLRRWVSVRARVAKAKGGMKRAARQRAVFHMWFHPMDMAQDREARLGGLEGILSEVDRLRRAGDLEPLTMGALAARYLDEP